MTLEFNQRRRQRQRQRKTTNNLVSLAARKKHNTVVLRETDETATTSEQESRLTHTVTIKWPCCLFFSYCFKYVIWTRELILSQKLIKSFFQT